MLCKDVKCIYLRKTSNSKDGDHEDAGYDVM
jgi:hypothetical protein